MKVVVTGGAGFIGSHTADACLARGHEVLVVDNFSASPRSQVPKGAKVYAGDIESPATAAAILAFRPKGVLHFAAQTDVMRSIADPMLDARVNVLGTVNVLNAAKDAGAEVFVFANSGGAVKGDPEVLPATEDTPPKPLSPYGTSKLAAGGYVDMFGRMHGIRTAQMFLSNVYGERQGNGGEGGVAAIFTKDMLQGRQPTIYGDGLQTRDLVYVRDVARVSVLALERPELSGPLIVSTNTETSIIDLKEMIKEKTGASGLCRFEAGRAGEVRRSLLSNEKLLRLVPDLQMTSLADGLSATVDYMRQRLQRTGRAGRPRQAQPRAVTGRPRAAHAAYGARRGPTGLQGWAAPGRLRSR
jgi:UDP-glucose 4-epimerase